MRTGETDQSLRRFDEHHIPQHAPPGCVSAVPASAGAGLSHHHYSWQSIILLIAEPRWCPLCVPDCYLLRVQPRQVLPAGTLKCHQTGGVIVGSGGVKLAWCHCR